MGEIAEMMLDGTLCEACGAYIDDDIPGHPRYCSRECARDRGQDVGLVAQQYVKCTECGKKVKAVGLIDHIKAKHLNKEKQ
jgi:hypothetical protein